MDTAAKTGVTDLQGARSDPSPLVDSVRESIQVKIDEINRAADAEIEKIDSDLRKEIEEFRQSQQKRYEAFVEYEGGKIRNLMAIEMKKQRLEGMESFIKMVTGEAAALVRSDPRYADFLIVCVITALENVKGSSATVLLASGDLVFSQDIMDRIGASGIKCKISISADDRIKLGGAMVVDDGAEVVYNSTVERIIYRENEEIRREIVRSLKEYEDRGI